MQETACSNLKIVFVTIGPTYAHTRHLIMVWKEERKGRRKGEREGRGNKGRGERREGVNDSRKRGIRRGVLPERD